MIVWVSFLCQRNFIESAYAPPSLFAYSSSIASSYRFSASSSACVFCVWGAFAPLGVDALLPVCVVAEVLEVDFSEVEGIGTGMLMCCF